MPCPTPPAPSRACSKVLGAPLRPTPSFPCSPCPFHVCSEVLEELRRLMPGKDPVATLLRDPSWLLRVERGRKRLGDDPDT